MEFTYFEIKNFKGIENIRLNLSDSPKQKIYTLVGLNESGKTTILEAINMVKYKSENLDPLELKGYNIENIHDLIPINKRDNFNDSILIEIGLSLNADDEKFISDKLKKELSIIKTRDINDIIIKQEYKFVNSINNKQDSKTVWYFAAYGKKKRQVKDRMLSTEVKQTIMKFVGELIPSILYFPNFLFDFPDKIYLEEIGQNDKKYKFYRVVVQDILDSLNNELNIEEHIVKRIRNGDSNDRKNMNSVLLKMEKCVTKAIFEAWNKIFKKSISDKSIKIECDIDQENDKVFMEFLVNDGEGLYQISERSLGFRWFFVFLLLTQFRKHRKAKNINTLFLLDEPASNLHSSAQAQLLKSFENLPSLIYTTHSHHMINPLWLEGTYVVKNEGLNYKNDDEYNSKKTNITLTKYRRFANKYPDQTSYYQPILDILDYAPSNLEFKDNAIFLEGKNDFYCLNYIQELIRIGKEKFTFIPGTSSSNLDNLISLYLGWGKNFLIILDSDKEGKKQKSRYNDEFGILVKEKIFDLSDVSISFSNYELENLFKNKELLDIQKSCYSEDTKYNKVHFNRALQELFITKKNILLSTETINNFRRIIDFIDSKINV
ncbi:MAG: AAA family ATPase [Ignavibacteria bacterium]|nr:AAA family ATPase [Ignavibacteria bacterium]